MLFKSLGISEDGHTLTKYFTKEYSNGQQITSEAAEVLESAGNALAANNSRLTVLGNLGTWFMVRKGERIFCALTAPDYPERIGYKALEDLQKAHLDFTEAHDLDTLSRECNYIIDTYNKPESFDKLSAAHKNINDLRLDVQKNIDKLVANDENLNELDSKARKMKENANLFNKNAVSLERTLWWKNIRLWCIIGATLIAIIVLIVLLVKLL